MSAQAYTIAVFSGKGGVGKSFIAAHIGRILAEKGYRTLVADIDLQCGGSLANMFHVKPSHPQTKYPHENHYHFIFHIQQNLDLLCPPSSLEQTLRIQKRDMSACIAQFQPFYDAIIIDLCHHLYFAGVSALSAAHAVWLISTDDWLSRYKTERIIQQLRMLGLPLRRMRIIRNAVQSPFKVEDQAIPTYSVPYDASFRWTRHGEMMLSETCTPYIHDVLVKETPLFRREGIRNTAYKQYVSVHA